MNLYSFILFCGRPILSPITSLPERRIMQELYLQIAILLGTWAVVFADGKL